MESGPDIFPSLEPLTTFWLSLFKQFFFNFDAFKFFSFEKSRRKRITPTSYKHLCIITAFAFPKMFMSGWSLYGCYHFMSKIRSREVKWFTWLNGNFLHSPYSSEVADTKADVLSDSLNYLLNMVIFMLIIWFQNYLGNSWCR